MRSYENSAPKLLLASSSPYRRELLRKLGLEFEWASPDIDETPRAEELPEHLVKRLAKQKARNLAAQYSHHLIIGSDQVATLDGQILGKPHTHSTAVTQLTSFRNKEVIFLTGLCLFNSATQKMQTIAERFSVKFRQLSPQQIENYLSREQPYDCAGSFKSEGLGICLFESMSGKDPNSLVGLPLISLINMLANEGISPLATELMPTQ